MEGIAGIRDYHGRGETNLQWGLALGGDIYAAPAHIIVENPLAKHPRWHQSQASQEMLEMAAAISSVA